MKGIDTEPIIIPASTSTSGVVEQHGFRPIQAWFRSAASTTLKDAMPVVFVSNLILIFDNQKLKVIAATIKQVARNGANGFVNTRLPNLRGATGGQDNDALIV